MVPLVKFLNYLATSPELERTRPRAIGTTVGIAVALTLIFGVLPVSQTLRAPGVLMPVNFGDVTTAVEGELDGIETPSGVAVNAGQPLVRLRNRDLELQLASARAQREELRALWRAALQGGTSDRPALEQALEAVEGRVRALEERQASLVVKASISGIWVAPTLDQTRGAWLRRGTALGQIVQAGGGFEFSAIVPQVEASRLFEGKLGDSVVRLHGQSEFPLPVVSVVTIQAEQSRLPSAALAQNAGGEVALARDARGEAVAAETFYEVRANLGAQTDAALLAGLTGRIAIDLPAEPLGWQWVRALRQAFQKRAVN